MGVKTLSLRAHKATTHSLLSFSQGTLIIQLTNHSIVALGDLIALRGVALNVGVNALALVLCMSQ
jgi:hypothetical protein